MDHTISTFIFGQLETPRSCIILYKSLDTHKKNTYVCNKEYGWNGFIHNARKWQLQLVKSLLQIEQFFFVTDYLCIQWNQCDPTPKFSDILWLPTKISGSKIFLLHSLLKNLEYSATCHFRHPTLFYSPSVINYTE